MILVIAGLYFVLFAARDHMVWLIDFFEKTFTLFYCRLYLYDFRYKTLLFHLDMCISLS